MSKKSKLSRLKMYYLDLNAGDRKAFLDWAKMLAERVAGNDELSFQTLCQVAHALGRPVEYFLAGTEGAPHEQPHAGREGDS